MELLYAGMGLLVSVGITWLVLHFYQQSKQVISQEEAEAIRLENQRLLTNLHIAEDRLSTQQKALDDLKKTLGEERSEIIELNKTVSSRESDYKNLKQKLDEQKAEIEQLQEKFSIQFRNLAHDIFEEKSKKFTEQNKTSLTDLLNPLKEKISDFEQKVERTNKENIDRTAALRQQIQSLKELNLQITRDAENLTKALKGDSKTQGNWGEMQLEGILEKAGLQKGIHYEKEKNLKSEDGQNQRLDYIIYLPDNKSLVIDSKVSLTAYSNYFNTADDDQQRNFLKSHLDSINTHIKLLSEKKYQNLYDIQQPDYVLMFIANEPALTIALKEDISLYEEALDRNIVLVSTSTLLATLRTISYIWKQDLQNKNALEIARQAGALYDKFTSFTEDLEKVGQNLDSTKKIYDQAMGKLAAGRDNLIRKSERLRELGAKTTKNIDQRLLDKADD